MLDGGHAQAINPERRSPASFQYDVSALFVNPSSRNVAELRQFPPSRATRTALADFPRASTSCIIYCPTTPSIDFESRLEIAIQTDDLRRTSFL